MKTQIAKMHLAMMTSLSVVLYQAVVKTSIIYHQVIRLFVILLFQCFIYKLSYTWQGFFF